MVIVESIKPISNAGNLRAFATINISDKIRIHDVRIIQEAKKRAWVGMPSRAYEKDGQRKWAPIVELLDKTLIQKISDAVLDEFSREVSRAPSVRVT